MEKYLNFEEHFDLTRDPATLSDKEVYWYAFLIHTHTTEHPDGGLTFESDEHQARCEDWIMRMSQRMLQLASGGQA